MTKNLNKKLEDAFNADFGDNHKAKHEAINKARREIYASLHHTQRDALKDAYGAIGSIVMAYRELYHPSYDDVVKLDDAFWRLRNAFAMDEIDG